MQKIAGVLGLFLFCFALGFSYLKYSTDSIEIDRNPAALRTSFDYSYLSGEKLAEAAKNRLLSGFEIRHNADGLGLGLGHFVFIDSSGEKKLACQAFKKVIFTFEADGVSVAGEKSTMDVEGPCEYSNDMAKINPLYIPIGKILNERPGDGEFQFNGTHPVTVRFSNLADTWPKTWLLKSVRLQTEKSSDDLLIESNEVARIMGHPIVISLK